MGGGYSYQLFTMYETYFDSNSNKWYENENYWTNPTMWILTGYLIIRNHYLLKPDPGNVAVPLSLPFRNI